METINLTIEIKDKEARKIIEKMDTKIETMNERTKKHTKDIQELRRKLK